MLRMAAPHLSTMTRQTTDIDMDIKKTPCELRRNQKQKHDYMEKCLQHKNDRDISTERGESLKANISIQCSLNSEMKVGDNHTEVLKHTDFEDHVTVHPNKTVSLTMSSIRTSSMAHQDHSCVVVEGPSNQLILDTVQTLSPEQVQRDFIILIYRICFSANRCKWSSGVDC